MNLIKTYIQNFLNRSGSYVLGATVLARILSFTASLIALKFIDKDSLGIVLYAWNIIAFLMPLIGAGLPQSLIRYGALLNNENDKKSLLHYVIKNGTFATIFLSFLVSVISLLYPFKFENTGIYIAIFSLSFIPHFLLETIKTQLRLEHNNKNFAKIDASYNIIFVILVFVLSFLYQKNGYIAALLLAPSIVCIVFYNLIKTDKKSLKKLTITNKEFWKYGFFGGLSNVTTMLLFAIDILLIGNLLSNPEMVTVFKYISLIPFSILFLPRVFIATDFVSFTEKIYNKKYIFKYIKSYMLLFGLISIFYVLFFYIFAENTLKIFDKNFANYTQSFLILNIGVCGILFLRGLFGNLLSSIGLVKVNYYITLTGLLINYFSNNYLIPIYGIKGASITSSCIMWLTGIASCICFFVFYRKVKK